MLQALGIILLYLIVNGITLYAYNISKACILWTFSPPNLCKLVLSSHKSYVILKDQRKNQRKEVLIQKFNLSGL